MPTSSLKKTIFAAIPETPTWIFEIYISKSTKSYWSLNFRRMAPLPPLLLLAYLFSWRVYVLVMVMLLLFDRLVKWSVAWLSYDRVFLTVTSCLVSCVYLIYLSFTELIVLKPNKNVNNRQWTTKKKLLTIDVGPEVVFSSVLCMWMTRFSITTSFSYQVL